MNISFFYKGQIVTIKSDSKIQLQRVYECSLTKFEQNFYKELQLFGTNLQFRSKRTQAILDLKDPIGRIVQDNDMVIIDSNNHFKGSNPNIHVSIRHDKSNIENDHSLGSFPASEYSQMKNSFASKSKNLPKFSYVVDAGNNEKEHRYQKSDQFPHNPKSPNHFSNPFDRSNTRRSLGADIAPQYDITDFGVNRINNLSAYHDSESSISDFSSLPKPLTNNKRPVQLRNLQTKFINFEKPKTISKSAPASPTKPMPPPRSPHTHMSMLNAYNVRTIGNKIPISIIKKPNVGLGFTIVTRDNQVQYGSAADIANSVVILVNKILPNGGAAEDNRLRPGDRLLEVNGVTVTSLKDATDKLRSIPEDENVNLLISRVDRCENSAKESPSPSNISPLPRKQITFEIPLNHNHKDRQQLGLNIRFLNESATPPLGPGIYIHSILDHSLASQQGGLHIDDKLMGINGRSLSNVTVEDTISQLKKIMQHDSVLVVTICRAVMGEPSGNDYESKSKNNLTSKKMSLDRKSKENTNHRNTNNSSHYSSSESLSPRNSSIPQVDPGSAFVRESKGRRSMSDKRKAHEDASQYNFYKETRIGDVQLSDDRLYSTLPTSSRLKKLSSSQPNNLSSKIQGPLKPSQMKQLNTPRTPQDPPGKVYKNPNRSTSLRSSPARINHTVVDASQSPKLVSQTLTHEQQLNFNRSMNNSFKRAVQKSLPPTVVGTVTPGFTSVEKSQSVKREIEKIPQQHPIENSYPISSTQRNTNDQFPRSNSVKDRPEKKKCFNLKSFLTFTLNGSKSKSVPAKEKSDTFLLNQQARYHNSLPQNSSTGIHKQPVHSPPLEMPVKVPHPDDPIIIDSTKRVLEWQLKNVDVITKENKIKEQKVYQTISSHGTATSKIKPDVNSSARAPISGRNTFPKTTTNQNRDSDPYDTIDITKTSPTSVAKQRASHPRSTRINNTQQHTVNNNSPKSARHNSHSTRITYQTINSRKTSPSNDIYATVNKSAKKDTKSPKISSGTSHGNVNKYRF